MQILIVEDDIQLAEMLTEALTDLDYGVDWVADGEAAWDWLRQRDYHLTILDLNLPKLDGISLCQRLRHHNFSVPILMLTARDTLADKVTGLEAGADDYLIKPFEMPELIARIRVLLRRGNAIASSEYWWGSLRLNANTHEVTYAGTPLHLTPKEFAILELLIAKGRRVFSRAEIVQRIWSGDELPLEETVKSHIKSLRHKLREVGMAEDPIETVHGVGYRLKPI